MPSSPSPTPWPPDRPGDPPTPRADEGYVSEFLSEQSAELKAVRQAVAEARPLPAPPAAVSAHAKTSTAASAAARPPKGRGVPWGWLVALVAVAVAGTAAVVVRQESTSASGAVATPAVVEGLATIISRPTGAEVFIDGTPRGVTPLKLSLPVGSYTLELRNGSAKRSLTLTVEAATAVREFVDLAPGAGVGRLEVTTDVAGARVSVDGVLRGVTPLVLPEIEPGVHRLAMTLGDSTVYRTVTVEAGVTATVVASIVPAGSSGGWLTITAPIEMKVIENGQVIGTTGATRLMLPVGPHELELVAEAYEFRTIVPTTIAAGRSVTIPVTVPNGRLSINASPWADVWLDGQPLGSTPLANISVPVGNHDVIWRHPQLGERRQTVRVTAQTPSRVAMDLNP